MSSARSSLRGRNNLQRPTTNFHGECPPKHSLEVGSWELGVKADRIHFMYSSALWLHSLLRWAVLFTGFVAWFRAIGGYTAKRPWTPKDDLWGMLLTISVDAQ